MSRLQEIIEIKIIDGIVMINNKKYTPLQSMKILGDIIFNVTEKQNIDRVISASSAKDYGVINDLRNNTVAIVRDEKSILIRNRSSITFTYKYKLLEIDYSDDQKTFSFDNKNNNINMLNKIIDMM